MSGASIVRPLLFSITSTGFAGAARLTTPEPKEVAVANGGAGTLTIDLGTAQLIDTIFVGFTNGAAGGTIQLSYGVASIDTAIGGPIAPLPTRLIKPRRHFLTQLGAPVTARYIGVAGNFAAGFEVGIAAVGKAFTTTLGHEQGAGRPIVDTGSAARRPDGGFGIDRGVRAGGFAWTYGDLSDDERDDLYALLLEIGTSGGPVLVIEETGSVPAGAAERVHWGPFTRIEQYERKAPEAKTVWSLRMEDWA